MASTRKSRLRPWIIGFVVFALASATVGFTLFSRWGDVRDALPPEAEAAFTAALLEAGAGPPYISITAAGVVVNRDLEGAAPRGFGKLKVLGWSASERKIVRVEYPRWFVQMKPPRASSACSSQNNPRSPPSRKASGQSSIRTAY